MEITWYGLSCFRLSERGYASIVTDPYRNGALGLAPLKTRADIVTISHDAPGHDNDQAVGGRKHTLTGPGEYEIGGVFITGIATSLSQATNTPNVVFLFDFMGVKVAHLGDMADVPTQTQTEALEQVDVLLVPVGGGQSLNAAQAAELVSMLEPNLVVPMHFHRPGLKLDLEGVDRFLKEMGVGDDYQEELSLRVSAASLPEETQVVVLTPRGET